ncbi:hypothetical protein [Caldivirga sp.]|uniref:hypothetical protein n=1 Tax=Caldivirga sp. TaxID=2080243 RepID=UPI003D0E6522
MPRLIEESQVLGVIFNYASTIVNYTLALAYIILLTKFIPLRQYGYYNAIQALLATIGLFFPTFGLDNAIAREGAMSHAKGGDVYVYYSGMFALTLTIASAYSLTGIALIPVFIRDGVPAWLMGVVVIWAIFMFVQSMNQALGFHLWAVGKVATQGVGYTLGSLVFRIIEIALIVVLRNVYAIAISYLIGQAVIMLYYLSKVRIVPSLRLGLNLIRSKFKAYLSMGFQYWIAYYLTSASGNIIAYLVFKMLGPSGSALYGLALSIIGLVSNFSIAVGTVFGSVASHGLSLGLNINELAKEYSSVYVTVSALITLAAITLTPLAPILHIINGSYAAVVPYVMLLFASAPVSVIDSIYMVYYWVSGKGWLAVERSTVGVLVSILIFLALAHSMGLYAAITSMYASTIAMLILYWLNNRPWGVKLGALVALSMILPTASAMLYVIYDPALAWPIPQLTITLAFTVIMLILKPIPRSLLADMPTVLRPLFRVFTAD